VISAVDDMSCSLSGVRKKAVNKQIDPFRAFVEVVVSGDIARAIRLLDASPHLVRDRSARDATRQAEGEFFERIEHYISEGDTALWVRRQNKPRLVKELIVRGADVREEQAWCG
jgi:hypothetical protein